MFLYTEKYTESESDIQNNDLLYKINQQCQNTFEVFEQIGKSKIFNLFKLLFCNMFKLHNSCFVNVVVLVFLDFLYFYIYIYYTCRSLTRVGLLHVYAAGVYTSAGHAAASHLAYC